MTARVRRFPRTTGVDAVGKCGHTFKTRVDVPDILARQVRTPSREVQFTHQKTRSADLLRSQDCPDCRAADSLQATRLNAYALTSQYNLPDLPELTGSARMVAFGEAVRFQQWFDQISDTCQTVHTLMNEDSLTAHLVTNGIHAIYPDPPTDSPSAPFPVEEGCCPRATNASMANTAVSHRLAEWILVRHLSMTSSPLYEVTDSQEWIRFAKSTYPHRYSPFKRDITRLLLPALLVASYRGWSSLSAAEQAFTALREPATETTRTFLDSSTGDPMPNLAEAFSVFMALQPRPQILDAPF